MKATEEREADGRPRTEQARPARTPTRATRTPSRSTRTTEAAPTRPAGTAQAPQAARSPAGRLILRTWLDIYPERLAHEVGGLRELGFEVDEQELERNRRLVMRGELDTAISRTALVIVYPDTFPFLRPEVFAPELRLERHHNPYEGNLCLLEATTREWGVEDTGALLVAEQVPFLLASLAAGGEAMREAEVPQGEPHSTYFRGRPGSVVFVPAASLAMASDAKYGRFELSFGPSEAPPTMRALLRSVTAKGQRRARVLAEAEPQLIDRYPGPTVEGRWVRLDQLPSENTPQALLAAAIEVDGRLASPRYKTAGDVELDVVGCVFAEEVAQGRWEDSWLFAVRNRQRTGPRRTRQGIALVRAERLTRDDLAARAPGLAALANRTVALAGLGALGSVIAIDLARSGVGEVRLLDHDRVEIGNTARWPFGLNAVGHRKVDVIAGWIRQEFPYTRVWGREWRIGVSEIPASLGAKRTVSEFDVLAEFWRDADLVIDATAELGVQHLVSTLALPTPQLYAWATEGAAGGAVVHTSGGRGCWLCLQHAMADGMISMPPAEPEATVQPRGCAARTFTGPMFDLAPIANQATRVAVAALLGEATPEHDVSICSLRDSHGLPTASPTWRQQELRVHPSCSSCDEALAA